MGNPTTPRDGHQPDPDKLPVLERSHKSGPRERSEEVLPLVEETATVHKRETVTGTVRVQTVTDAVEELAQASLESISVEVTRVPIDRVVDVAPMVRTEDEVVIIPVLEEILV